MGSLGCVDLSPDEMGGKGMHSVTGHTGFIGGILKHKAARFGVSPVGEVRLVLEGAVNGGGCVPVVRDFAV